MPHKKLTNKGYALNKKKLGKTKLARTIKDLTVTPKFNADFGGDVESYTVYTETKDTVYVPRYYGLAKFGEPDITQYKSNPANISFQGSLRSYQEPVVKTCMESLKTTGGGVVSLYCGAGKTTVSLYLACQLKVKTLVVVHKSFLQDQWIERIEQFTDAKIGTIRQDKIDTEDKDIVIAMLQSVSMRDYDQSIFEGFDLVIFDECHHASARVFSQGLRKTSTRYTIGLSATPTRSDGTMKVVHWYLGDIICKLERKGDHRVAVKNMIYDSDDKKYTPKVRYCKNKKTGKTGKNPDTVKMVTNITNVKDRNRFVTDVVDTLRQKYERKILVMAERRDHLDTLKEMMDILIKKDVDSGKLDEDEVTTAFYRGKMKAYELEAAAEADIIFATYNMAEEGLDIDRLNTLVLASPWKKITQTVGRILRKPVKKGETPPLVVDIMDQLSSFTRWGDIHNEFYRKNRYTVNSYLAFNDRCVSVGEYLVIKNVLTKKQLKSKKTNIEKEWVCYNYGEDRWNLMQMFSDDSDSDDDDEDDKEDNINEIDWQYKPDLDKLLEVDTD